MEPPRSRQRMTDFNIIAAAVRLTAPANARYTPKIAKLRTRSATIASDSWIGHAVPDEGKDQYQRRSDWLRAWRAYRGATGCGWSPLLLCMRPAQGSISAGRGRSVGTRVRLFVRSPVSAGPVRLAM